jgi:Ca-activated chloride channel family protein
MTFANADAFLLLLLLIPLALFKILGDGVARRRLHRIAGPRLLPQLRRGGWRGRGLLIFLFEALALTFLITALARPQWGFTQREIQGQGRSLIIAVDTSRSMLATDLTPDRLTRAKLAAQDLVTALPGDKIGLIAFAGRAFLQAPLTTDHEALLEALSQFDTELIPRGGSNLSEPIELAGQIFDKAGTASHALIMFSDGDELEGQAVAVARKAKEKNIMVVAVGVGTPEGSLLPDDRPRNRGGHLRDASGRPVRSKLEDGVLESIARETGGLYLNLSGSSVLKERIQVILNKLDRSKTAALKEQRQPIDRYQWALIPAIACLVIAWLLRLGRRLRIALPPAWAPAPGRTPATAAAALLALALAGAGSGPAAGGVLVPTGEDRGPSPWQAFQKAEAVTNVPGELTEEQRDLKQRVYGVVTEKFERALADAPAPARAAELEFGRGASLFRAADHDAAIDAFGRALTSPSRSLQAEAAYNLGNALADKAKNLPKQKNRLKSMIALIEEAIRHYDETLTLEPAHENARTNRDLLKEYLPKLQEERRKRIEQGKQKQKQPGEQEGDKQEGQQGQQGQQDGQSPGQQGNQGPPGAGGESEEETDDEGEGEEPGNEGAGDQEGEKGKGEQPGEQPGQGQGDQEGAGQGPKPSDREQAAPEGDDKERRGEQEGEGPLGTKGNAEGGEGKEEGKENQPGSSPSGDAKRNPKTGFSRSEARALLRALSDEDYVRPLTDEARPEGTYKNW